jgi:hypothetical protein
LKPLSKIILRIRTRQECEFIGSHNFTVFRWCAFLRTWQSYKQALLLNATKSTSMTGQNNGGQGQGDRCVGRNGHVGSGRKGGGAGYSSQGKPKSTKVGLCKELEGHRCHAVVIVIVGTRHHCRVRCPWPICHRC